MRFPPRSAVACSIAAVVALSACGGGKKDSKRAAAKVKAPVAEVAIAPFTGLPDATRASLTRCAITVKIDNTKNGHPKYGVEQADVVYEEVVEGGITRLAAVFNAQAPDRVGPVRSVRKTDQSIVRPYRGIFVYSGGAPYA